MEVFFFFLSETAYLLKSCIKMIDRTTRKSVREPSSQYHHRPLEADSKKISGFNDYISKSDILYCLIHWVSTFFSNPLVCRCNGQVLTVVASTIAVQLKKKRKVWHYYFYWFPIKHAEKTSQQLRKARFPKCQIIPSSEKKEAFNCSTSSLCAFFYTFSVKSGFTGSFFGFFFFFCFILWTVAQQLGLHSNIHANTSMYIYYV